jgi:ribonuclease HII
VRKTGRKLLNFDRRLGARFVAGADEAGRGSLAAPLVTAAVLFDDDVLREHKVRPLSILNDSKQLTPDERARLFRPESPPASDGGAAQRSHPATGTGGLPG